MKVITQVIGNDIYVFGNDYDGCTGISANHATILDNIINVENSRCGNGASLRSYSSFENKSLISNNTINSLGCFNGPEVSYAEVLDNTITFTNQGLRFLQGRH